MNRRHEKSIYHANVNVDLMKENVIHISGGITTNAYVIVKNVMCVKIMLAVLLHVVVRMGNVYQVLWKI